MSNKETPIIKLLLLGDSAVGKSSLLTRFCDGKFDANFVITIGVDFKSKNVLLSDGRDVKVHIWDTAGQERFRTITPAYYRSAMGVCLCYDVTDETSFKNIEFWLENLREFASTETCRILIGNKCDLSEKAVISKEMGEALANKYGMSFFETSAKTNLNVDTAFAKLVEEVASVKFPHSNPNGNISISNRNVTTSNKKCC